MSTFSEMIQKPRSRKISLVQIGSSKRLRFFTSLGLDTYEKSTEFFVEKLSVDGVVYTRADVLTVNTFNYSVATGKLTFKTNGINPEIVYVVPTFKHFFSNLPIVLPWDLQDGELVAYEPRLSDLGSVKLELDFENSGISLESDSSITLENNDRYFDNFFDTYLFENKDVFYYYFFENLLPSQAKLAYKGVVQDKSFNSRTVKFNVKDKFLTLRDNLKLNLFDENDGEYDQDLFLKPKRRIYGEVSKLQVTGTDKLKSSFAGVGTVSGQSATSILNGVGTTFLKDLSVGDRVVYTNINGSTSEVGIQDILTDTQAFISEEIEVSFTGRPYEVQTEVYSKHFNRKFNIAGHKIVELSQAITEILSYSIFRVANIDGYEIGSLVELNSKRFTIKRAYGDLIVLNQNVSPLPVIGDIIYRVPVFKAYHGPKELTFKTDYDIENLASDCNLVLYDNAEANVTVPTVTAFNLIFTNGSRSVTCPTSDDLSLIFKSRELIKPNNVNYPTYYEVLLATPTEVRLREPFNEITINSNALYKKVDYVKDDSIVAVDSLGIANDAGAWIRYPSEIVEHILIKDAKQVVNSASFLESRSTAEFKVSCYFPDVIGNESPVIRECITTINNSVFGSLYYDDNYDFKYSILNSNKPEEIKTLHEDDVISYEVVTRNRIFNNAKIKYKPQLDLLTGEVVTDVLAKESEFVNRLIGYSKEEILETILFNKSDAQIILNRFLFFNSLSNSLVKIRLKLDAVELNLNQPLFLKFDRIYKRYSGSDASKIGLINYIEKDESNCTIQINDLSGVFNRVPAIAPNTLVDLNTSSLDQIAKYGFIVDNINETPDNTETYLGSNLIG